MPMNTGAARTASSRDDVLTLGACRTCQLCRRRKTRCDGQKPQCGGCAAKGQTCTYPQDGRKALVRGKKADIRQLQQELDNLRRQNQAFGDQSISSPHRHQEPTSQIQMSAGEIVTVLPEVEPDVQAQPRTVSGQSTCGDGCPNPSVSRESRFEDSDERVYGSTSLLHDSQSVETAANEANMTPSVGEQKAKAYQNELVAKAAIGRQQEAILHNQPSLYQTIDFDGVPIDLAMYLLDLHWNRQHLSYLLTYRPAIMDSLVTGGPYINPLLLNAIYFSTCLYDDRFSSQPNSQISRTSPSRFYNRIKELLYHHIDKPSLPTIVALLLCGSSMVPHGEQGAGWVFCGMGYRMIVDLGYHLSAPVKGSESNTAIAGRTVEEMEMRRRLYWGAYVCDTFQSMFLGRQPSLYHTHPTISTEYYDVYEENEDWKPHCYPGGVAESSSLAYIGRPALAISTFYLLRKLCGIGNFIIESFYSTPSRQTSQDAALHARKLSQERLDDWRRNMPPSLDFNPDIQKAPPPHQITPHTMYWSLVILSEQPLLKAGQFDFVVDSHQQDRARARCIEAALQIWKILKAYREAFTFRRAQYSISYGAYCAVLAMLQHAPQDDSDYHECIQFLWTTLWEHQRGCSQGLKRPLGLLKSLMDRVGKVRQQTRHPSAEDQQNAPHDNSLINADSDQLEQIQRLDNNYIEGYTADWLTSVPVDMDFSFIGDMAFDLGGKD